MIKIYLVGNELVEEDSLPIKIKSALAKLFPKVVFEEFDPTENLPEDSKHLILIDTVYGLDKPQIFHDIDAFSSQKAYSMHDFDLGWQLKLYKKLKMIDEVSIIGIPMGMQEDIAIKAVSNLINDIVN